MDKEFHFWRSKPILIYALDAQQPLVMVGGKYELSEEFFDANSAIDKQAGIWFGFYDLMLAGGEPYAAWF